MNAHQPPPLSNRERVARRRQTQRAEGLRPRQFWLPDLGDPVIAAEIAREVARINASNGDDLAFAMAVQYWPPED
jgi:Protein  of unknown function (DUF3018)